jgi:Eukaryotic and archaeal DNA primase, large subunit
MIFVRKGLKDVMEYTNSQQPILACQKLFVLSHPGKGVEFGLSHPNQYFKESRDIITGVSVKAEPGLNAGWYSKNLLNNLQFA